MERLNSVTIQSNDVPLASFLMRTAGMLKHTVVVIFSDHGMRNFGP